MYLPITIGLPCLPARPTYPHVITQIATIRPDGPVSWQGASPWVHRSAQSFVDLGHVLEGLMRLMTARMMRQKASSRLAWDMPLLI